MDRSVAERSVAERSVAEIERALTEFITKDVLLLDTPPGRDEDLFAAGFDSLSLSRLLVFVEEKLGVRIADQDVVVDEIETLAKMAKFVFGYLKSAEE